MIAGHKTTGNDINRRTLFKGVAAGLGSSAAASGAPDDAMLEVDPEPRFDLSPFLYMQFMEPLGTTDGSVEAAWDYNRQDWREDLVAVTKELAPAMVRWGGIFTDYYRWREGVGPRDRRPVMRNLLWGGIESNQVGTAEFVGFCRAVGAEPLIGVNFESDGRQRYMEADGKVRTANAAEAAEWVAYCNQPRHPGRIANGAEQPYNVRFWQIGNETSYNRNGFDLKTAARKTVEFAKAMRRADPKIQLIGWGDRDWSYGRDGKEASDWARGMIEAAGEYINYIAFHHMFNPDVRDQPVLAWGNFRKDPARTWEQLMSAYRIHEEKIRWMREKVTGSRMPLAMTECHYSIPGRNRCEVLSTWAAGVSYARLLNVHERHGDVLKIATAADFCGTRWQNNAVIIPVPGGRSFLMPVAHVMRLYRRHSGDKALAVRKAPGDLDVTASGAGDRVFLHVVNTNRTRSVEAKIAVGGRSLSDGKAYEIAADPMLEVLGNDPDALRPNERNLPADGQWSFPAASVTALEFSIRG
jgi:alpha-N-arabinofuranosidase